MRGPAPSFPLFCTLVPRAVTWRKVMWVTIGPALVTGMAVAHLPCYVDLWDIDLLWLTLVLGSSPAEWHFKCYFDRFKRVIVDRPLTPFLFGSGALRLQLICAPREGIPRLCNTDRAKPQLFRYKCPKERAHKPLSVFISCGT